MTDFKIFPTLELRSLAKVRNIRAALACIVRLQNSIRSFHEDGLLDESGENGGYVAGDEPDGFTIGSKLPSVKTGNVLHRGLPRVLPGCGGWRVMVPAPRSPSIGG